MKDLLYMPITETYSDGSELLDIFIGENPKKAKGIKLLLQIWVSKFLSEAGHAVLSYEDGGGIQSLLGRNATSIKNNNLKSIITIATQKTNEEVIRDQIEEGITDEDELLETCYILDIKTSGDSSADVYLRLVSVAGNSVSAAIPFIF